MADRDSPVPAGGLEITQDERSELRQLVGDYASDRDLSVRDEHRFRDLSIRLDRGHTLRPGDTALIDEVLDSRFGDGTEPPAALRDLWGMTPNERPMPQPSRMRPPASPRVFDLSSGERQQLAGAIRRWVALKNQREYRADWSTGGMDGAELESWTRLADTVEQAGAFVSADDTARIEQVLRATYLDPSVRPATPPRGGELARWVKSLEATTVRGEQILPGVDGPSTKEHTMAGTDQVPQDSWESSPEAEGAGWGEPDVPAPAAAAAPAQQQGTRYGRPTTTENIPVSGFLASEPKYTPAAGNKKSFIRARLGLHSFSKGPDGESVDHPNYVDLAAFGRLADKMNGALKKGDDVTGVATQEISTVTRSDGNSELRVRYVADRLGPDLMSGKAQVALDRKREHRVDQQVTPANVAAAQSRSSSIHM